MNDQNGSNGAQQAGSDQTAPPRRRGTGRKIAAALGWCLLAVAAWVAVQQTLLKPTPVAAVKQHRGELRQEVFGTGTLESKVVVNLSAKITGKVAEVLADQGDSVTNGQPLARLEAVDFQDAARAAEADLAQAQTELAKAQLDLKRDRDLVEGKVLPKSDFDATETAYRVCEARVKNAEAQLGVARARLADTQIISPVSGLVITRNLEVGSTVVPGSPIFRLAETNVLWVQAMVDEREVGKLTLGQPARVTFRSAPGQPFPGRLARLAREADRVTEEREADVAVERLPPEWFIGAKADVYIETARKADVPQLPAGAIIRRGDQPGVFVIAKDRIRWHPVSLGLAGRETVELVSGIESNDQVVANPFAGKQPLADGQRVFLTGGKAKP